jgi:hypothetical protein
MGVVHACHDGESVGIDGRINVNCLKQRIQADMHGRLRS